MIALIAGVALSGVYSMTKNSIDEQEQSAQIASYREACPEADSFEFSEEADRILASREGAITGEPNSDRPGSMNFLPRWTPREKRSATR